MKLAIVDLLGLGRLELDVGGGAPRTDTGAHEKGKPRERTRAAVVILYG